MTDLTTKAINGSTYVITCSFADADGTAVTPSALTWSLTDDAGKVINSRSSVVISPAATVTIVLGADDLDNDQGSNRIITIEGTYNSSTYGNNLPIKEQASFTIGLWVE